jgi:hypothetical protein
VKKRIKVFREKHVQEDKETEDSVPPAFFEGSSESPNRVFLPRKIGKHRPEEERGYKPTVI